MFRPVPNRASLSPTEPSWISGGVEECILCAKSIAQSLANSSHNGLDHFESGSPSGLDHFESVSPSGLDHFESPSHCGLDAFDSVPNPGLDAFDFNPTTYAARHASWLSTKIDCTAFLTWFIENYPSSVDQTRKADAGFWARFK